MTVVNPKSISGINSITTGSGSDNLLTIHTSDASSTERVRINSSGDVIVGSGITVSPDGDIFTTGVTTATSFVGSGANLTGVLSDVVEDTSPQLGGNLDVNTKNIVFGDSGGATDDRLTFGDGTDLSIYHDGSNSRIAESGTGHLILTSNGNGVLIQDLSSGSNMAKFLNSGAVELYHNYSKRFETKGAGANFYGDTGDHTDVTIYGSEGRDANLELFADDGDDNADKWRILASTDASFYLQNYTSGSWEFNLKATGNGAVELYHDNTKQCETAADGLAFPSGKGINFNLTADASGTGVTAGSETLDDYEEGTWTPTFDAGGGVTFSYNHQYGFYTKIGDTVTFQLYLMGHASSISSGNGGNGVVIQGLPFTILNHSRYYPAFTVGRTYHFDIDSDKRLYSYGDSNSTNIRLIVESDDTAGTVLTAQQLDNNPCLTQIGGFYRV